MFANSEKLFDDYGYLDLLLFFYEIIKTIVFWNIFFSSIVMTGSFDRLYFTASKHAIEMLVQRIYSMFRMKPLDMRHFQEDTMLMRQQRHHENNYKEEFEWLKLKTIEKETQNERDQQFTIYDWLADVLDFLLNTKSRNGQRYFSNLKDPMLYSMPSGKLATKDLRSFRNLNTPIVEDALNTSKNRFICQKCRLAT